MATNFFGVVHAVQPVLDRMIGAGRGHIAVVSSIAAFRGTPRTAGYCASKAAVSTLFEGWGIDLMRNGITMTSIHPGYVETPILSEGHGKLPFIMPPERAARIIVRGLARKKTRIVFPWQMRWLMRIMKLLPDWLYRRVISRFI
jgi:short-subunit dehydrogenase